MIVEIEVTQDILRLLSNIHFLEFPEKNENGVYEPYSIDMANLYGGSFLFEDMANILGKQDLVIEGTECDAEGPSFPDEVEEYFIKTHHYIIDNLKFFESLIHQTLTTGGLKVGKYKCKDYEMIWQFIG